MRVGSRILVSGVLSPVLAQHCGRDVNDDDERVLGSGFM